MQFTLLIKTFLRRSLSKRLLDSIKKYYPQVQVVIVDDSPDKMEYDFSENMQYHLVPFDTGISAGRNYGLRYVTTPYFVLLDDDTYFKDITSLEVFLRHLEDNPGVSLVAGVMDNSKPIEGEFTFVDNGLKITPIQKEKDFTQADITQNFFMARTDDIRQVLWDKRLKINEHFDFFLRMKKRGFVCHHTDLVNIGHESIKEIKYNRMRERFHFRDKALDYNNLEFIEFPYGKKVKRKKK